MTSALDGLRVLEIVDSIAGQYLGQLLADQGADVLKAEPPAGDSWRGRPQFSVWNRGKRSVVADLTDEAGLAFVIDLASRSDVVITDLGPRASEESRLRYEDLSAANPTVIHAWLPPYGIEGQLADLPPDDALAEAIGGTLASQVTADGDPVLLTLPLASYATAMLAASAVCAAIFARERDGQGQQVAVSWLAGALALHTGALVQTPGGTSILGGAARVRQPQGALGAYKLYKAADDWLFLPCGNNTFYNKLLVALDRADLLGEERFQQGPWGLKADVNRELREIIAPIIAAQPREHWLRFFDEQDVPVAPVLSRENFISDPQVIHNGLRLELNDPDLGRVAMAGIPVEFEDTPGVVRGPAPSLGGGTATALDAWPQRPRERPSTEPTGSARPPLDGVRVIDLTSYIAGSLCPMILADYGADVIKVESLEGDAFRAFGLGFLGWNRGKRGIALDLKAPEAREVLHELVRGADVLVENFRVGVSARLGVDYESLREVNRDIIYCSIPGWGESGPYTGKPVFDPIFQARSGAQRAQGGDGPPVFLTVAITDYSAAHLTAYAATAGLLARKRTGHGQKVSVTLAGATMAIQAGEFVFPEGGGSFGHAVQGGADSPGLSAAYRGYHCSDAWLFIACTTEVHWQAMAKAIGRPEFAYPNSWPAVIETEARGGVAAEIESVLAEDTVGSWMDRLSVRGVPCAPIVPLAECLDHPQVVANGYEAKHEHQKWGKLRQTGVLAKFSRTPGVAQRPGPMLGEHTDEVLKELGYDAVRVAELRENRVVL
ncbi:MAG: CoA transferase [Chloroflexi bacterium]|nr:CoA transferase [Chloroflexota bacterium]